MDAPEPHRFALRIYWEDTDAAGIVYYANYLKFIERARTEALLAAGIRQTELRGRLGVVFVVREARVRYLAAARLEDQLVVTTAVERVAGARIELRQDVLRGSETLAECLVMLACLRPDGRPARVPAEVRNRLRMSALGLVEAPAAVWTDHAIFDTRPADSAMVREAARKSRREADENASGPNP